MPLGHGTDLCTTGLKSHTNQDNSYLANTIFDRSAIGMANWTHA